MKMETNKVLGESSSFDLKEHEFELVKTEYDALWTCLDKIEIDLNFSEFLVRIVRRHD